MEKKSSPNHRSAVQAICASDSRPYFKRYLPFLYCVFFACSEAPSTLEDHLAQGDAFLTEGRTSEAIASYRMAMHQDSLNPKVYASLARAYRNQNNQPAADRYIRRAMNITFKAGLQALESGEDSTALAAFTQTIDIFPRHPLALTKIAEIYQARQQSDKALHYLEKAAEANPSFAATFVILGQLYAKKDRAGEAKAAFGTAIQLNINALGAYLGLGQLYLDEQVWLRAAEQFDKALLIDPHSPTALAGLAKAQSNFGNL